MYRLVIVDDEDIIRRGLADLVDWAEMGFELTAAFQDGDEVIEYLHNNSVDVVLADIRMVNVSGLEVAEYIHENMPSIKVVIISGYKEFEYAKKAIDYNVEHYLLKPTQFDEITHVFSDIKERLDEEREKENTIFKFKERYKELIPIMQEQFFTDLLMGALRGEHEIKKRMELLNLNFNANRAQCFVVDVCVESYNKYLNKHWEYEKEEFKTALNKLITKNEGKDGIHYFALLNNGSELKSIAIAENGNEINVTASIINKHLHQIMESIYDSLGYKIGLKIEYGFNNIFALANQKKPFIIYNDKSSDEEIILMPKEYERLIDKYKLFMSNVHDGDLTAITSLIDTFMDEIQALPLRYIHRLIIDLFSALTNKSMELNTDLWEIITGIIDYHHIVDMNDVEEIRRWLKKAFKNIINSFDSYKKISSNNVIHKAKQFIDKNYYKDISLSDVADQIFLNPVYFSRLFKQETGQNFIDYLTGVRMEKAIDLLKENRYKAYEISDRIGYKNSRYFFRVFKQYTGYTTKEYARLVLKKDGERYE